MSRLVFDLEALAELVDRMAGLQDQVSRVCEDADARVHELHGSWSGAAAAAYATAHEQWRAGAVEAQEALAVLRSIASVARANYAAAVAANRGMWAL
jgi:WXG100 family type VII secretion target